MRSVSARKAFGLSLVLGIIALVSISWQQEMSIPDLAMLAQQAAVMPASFGQLRKAPRFLDGCRYVYVDVGTNVGLQIRKLFEPELYPNSSILPKYDQYFGTDRHLNKELCAVGFEPNVHLEQELKDLEAAYNRKGWRTKIYTSTAAADHDGTADFFFDTQAIPEVKEWGSSLIQRPGVTSETAKSTVQLLDLPKFLLEEVGQRQFETDDGRPPMVMMKIDVEGAEWVLLPRLVSSGGWCQVNYTYAEWHFEVGKPTSGRHNTGMTTYAMVEAARFFLSGCPGFLGLDNVDDENFQDKPSLPLPARLLRSLRRLTGLEMPDESAHGNLGSRTVKLEDASVAEGDREHERE